MNDEPRPGGERTRARTRRAILDAAVATLSQNGGASLADIAAAANVGRTTVHRYFAERGDLLAALGLDAFERIVLATERARVGDGPAPDALARLCEEYFELGDTLMLVFNDPNLRSDPAWEQETPADRAVTQAIERGQAEGTIDPRLDQAWIQQMLWALLYTAWEYSRSGSASKHDALGLCLRSLRNAVQPRPAD